MKNVTIIRARAIDPAVNKIAKSLSQHGYNVKLLVWDRQNDLEIKNDAGYKICSFNLNAPYDKLSALLFLPLWWIYEFTFLIKDKSDIIHACDLDTLIPAILAKMIKRVRLCYTIYDFWANNLPDGNCALLRNFVRRIISSIEKFGVGFTEILFLVDESRYQEVKGAKINNIEYIYNSPFDFFLNKRKKTSRPTRKFTTIFYSGIVLEVRGLRYMIQAVQQLENVKLIMAGYISDNNLIKESKSISKDGKIQHIGWLPTYSDVIKITSEADILFRFSDPKHPKTKFESPNKLFEAMMCSKPIIVSDNSAMADIVKKENCGIVVPYGDVNAIKKAILKLKKDHPLYQKLGKNGRIAYEKRYSWKIMEERLINAYNELMTS